MQLTKDDVLKETEIIESYDDSGVMMVYLNYSKFLEVRAFYEKHKDEEGYQLFKKEKDIIPECLSFMKYIRDKITTRGWNIKDWNDWLFSYCFIEGLK
jgi:hypothetical protein